MTGQLIELILEELKERGYIIIPPKDSRARKLAEGVT
jgi:hypothetical protein